MIYLIRNNINNKVYIGQTVEKGGFDRRYRHNLRDYTHNEHLRNSIDKYGIENFYIDKEFDVAYSQEELNKLEDMYIKTYNSTDKKFGYNKRFGGANGRMSEETKLKLKGRTFSEYSRLKISKTRLKRIKEGKIIPWDKGIKRTDIAGEKHPFYGKHHSEETRRKISDANKGKYVGENNPMYGKRFYGQDNPNYGNKWSEDQRKKASEYWKEHSHFAINNPNIRKVINLDTLEVFDSIKLAKEKYTKGDISACVRGKTKKAGGYRWMYYDEKINQTI